MMFVHSVSWYWCCCSYYFWRYNDKSYLNLRNQQYQHTDQVQSCLCPHLFRALIYISRSSPVRSVSVGHTRIHFGDFPCDAPSWDIEFDNNVMLTLNLFVLVESIALFHFSLKRRWNSVKTSSPSYLSPIWKIQRRRGQFTASQSTEVRSNSTWGGI